MMAWMKRFP